MNANNAATVNNEFVHPHDVANEHTLLTDDQIALRGKLAFKRAVDAEQALKVQLACHGYSRTNCCLRDIILVLIALMKGVCGWGGQG